MRAHTSFLETFMEKFGKVCKTCFHYSRLCIAYIGVLETVLDKFPSRFPSTFLLTIPGVSSARNIPAPECFTRASPPPTHSPFPTSRPVWTPYPFSPSLSTKVNRYSMPSPPRKRRPCYSAGQSYTMTTFSRCVIVVYYSVL